MVQRKVPNKLGIQADHVKSEKRLANLKPSCYQLQDGKNTGPDMKKKMKKSRSFKISDIEGLGLSALKKTLSQPGKPPPLSVPLTATTTATPQKQTPLRASDGSPNYMKSTSSSEARKESSQVSSPNYLRRRSSSSNSKLCSASSNKQTRGLTRSSSLKLVRTLTKTPSFKHVRGGAKKCSRVVICTDVNAQRATCSSTLKDSKFPDYLMLNPGATEAEGTSAVKVCPYTYCSLNGHHHKPLPPLKCFLSARRRLLKTQKSMKQEALSPRRAKPVDEGTDEIDAGQLIFDNKPAHREGDLDGSPRSPFIQEGGMDFFIEIYAKSKEDKSGSARGGCDEANVDQSNVDNIAEILCNGSPCSEIDSEENLEQCSDIASMGVEIMQGFAEEVKVEDLDKEYSTIAAQTEGVAENTCNGSNCEDESNAGSEENDNMSEASEMDWEEGQLPTLELDDEANGSMKDGNESDLDDECLSEINDHDLNVELIAKSDNFVVCSIEKILADEIHEEESACSEAQEDDSDSEMNNAVHNLEIVESSQESDNFSDDQGSSTEEADTAFTSSWREEPNVESTTSIKEIVEKSRAPEAENEIPGPQVGDTETNFTPEDRSLQDDGLTIWLQNQISDSFQHSEKGDQVVINEDYNRSHETEDSKTYQKVSISGIDVHLEIQNREAGDRMEQKEQVVIKRSIGVQVPDDLFEVYEGDLTVDDSQNNSSIDSCHLEDAAEESNSFEDKVDDENQEHLSDGICNNTIVAENRENLQRDEEKDGVKKCDIMGCIDSEEKSDSSMYKVGSPEGSIGEVEKMEVEDRTQSETTETFPMACCETAAKLKGTSFPLERESKEELSSNCGNLKWAIGSKRTPDDDDDEGLRKFNPREPNYLPIVPEPDAEKVDLKHQMMDERKNSEEWMVDYALRQAVTKLAPARKKRVALLVEAFETVLPTPKWETRLRHSPAAFAPTRPIQACS